MSKAHGVDLLALIEDDTHRVSYRPSWNQFTGSVNATLLLQQIIYWWIKSKRRPFYKFNQPCDHPHYRTGDSWLEELGMGRSEFETARRKIAAKTKGNVEGEAMVSYWSDPERRTWYALNETAVIAQLQALYPTHAEAESTVGIQADFDLMRESSIRSGVSPDFADPNAEIQHYVMQESSISYCGNSALALMQESSNRNTESNRDHNREYGKEGETPHPPYPAESGDEIVEETDEAREWALWQTAVTLASRWAKYRGTYRRLDPGKQDDANDYFRPILGLVVECDGDGEWAWRLMESQCERMVADGLTVVRAGPVVAQIRNEQQRAELPARNGRSSTEAVAAQYAQMRQEFFSDG